MNRLRFLPFVLLISLLVACSGGGDDSEEPFASQQAESLLPTINNSQIVVGPNRMVFYIQQQDGSLVTDATVKARYYDLSSGQPVLVAEDDALLTIPAKDSGLPAEQIVTLPDGTQRTINNLPEEIGFFTSNVSFPKAGDFGVQLEVDARTPTFKGTLPGIRFNVLATDPTPAIGSPAPASVNRVVGDGTPLEALDTSASPSPEMHTMTIADAIASGKPTLILFAAPGFCTSRICGPELEIVRKLAPQYESKVNFIHVEFYENPGTARQAPVATAKEWNLRSEPWFFLVDANGIIQAKMDGPAGLQELTRLLDGVTSSR